MYARQQHTTGKNRSTHPQPCTAAVQRYYSSTAVRTFLRVLYNNIHHHAAFARELEEKEKNTEQDQPAVRFIFHLVVEYQVVYSRGNRTPESEKKQTSVYLIKRKMKKKILVHVPGTYISPIVVALAAGVNANPSSRERFFLRTANPRQDPNS